MAGDTNLSSSMKTNSVVKFYKEIKAEFKKITWAPKEDIINATEIVLVTVTFFTLVLWFYDSIFGKLLSTILSYLK